MGVTKTLIQMIAALIQSTIILYAHSLLDFIGLQVIYKNNQETHQDALLTRDSYLDFKELVVFNQNAFLKIKLKFKLEVLLITVVTVIK